MRRRLAALAASLGIIASSVALATTAQAETVVEFSPTDRPYMDFWMLSEGGQIFTLPNGHDVISEVSIHVGANPGTETQLRIHAWDAVNEQPSGDALFTSDPVTYDDGGWPETLTFDTDQLQLEPDTQYVAVIDGIRFTYHVLEPGDPYEFFWNNTAAGGWTRPSSTGTVGLAYRMVFLQTPTVTALDPSEGQPGTEVAIAGTGFENATAVDFGDVPAADFTVLSDTEILAVAPEQPVGTVASVQVTADTLPSAATPASEFTYVAVPVDGGGDDGTDDDSTVTPVGTADSPAAALPNVGAASSWTAGLLGLALLGLGVAVLSVRRERA